VENSPTSWRSLPLERGDARALVERAEALFDALRADPRPTLRWYRPDTPAIVLGRGQGPADVRAAALPVVQRTSGGGAVLLSPDVLSLDVLLPAGHALLAGDLAAVFVPVGRAWAGALSDLGVAGPSVHLGPSAVRRRGSERERLLAAVCYATLGRGEVSVAGRKLVGLSQRRRRWGALVQCGLLRSWQPAPLLAALGASPDDADITCRAVGLDELVRPAPPDDVVMAAVEARLAGYSLPA
jgi:lipoate---protein ligase